MYIYIYTCIWDFLLVQWLRPQASNAGGMSSIPGQGTKISHDSWHSQKIKINKIAIRKIRYFLNICICVVEKI